MNQNNPLLIGFHLILLVSIAFGITSTYGYTMLDDGWRHLSMAFQQEQIQSWGNIFINSLYGEYDPWFLWHKFLNFLNFFVSKEQIPLLVNTITYSLVSIWVYIMLRRHSSLNIYFILLMAIGIPLYTIRYYSLRPDLLSGLLILSVILIRQSKLALFILTLLYFPFYYIFWFFLGYIGFVKLMLKEYKEVAVLFAMTLLGFAFHLWIDFDGYIHMMQNIFNNETLLQGYSVTESHTFLIPQSIKLFLGSMPLLLILMILSALFLHIFKPKTTLFKYLILFAPLALVQIRFFQLLAPLYYVCLVLLIHQLITSIQNKGLFQTIESSKYFLKEKTYLTQLSQESWTKAAFLILGVVFFSQYTSNLKLYKSEEKLTNIATFFHNKAFENKRIFISSMSGMMYRAILFNPTGQYMPNCSLGWVDMSSELKEIYFKIYRENGELSQEEFFKFINYNNFDYLVLIASRYQHISFTENKILENGYKFEKIINGNVIFSRK